MGWYVVLGGVRAEYNGYTVLKLPINETLPEIPGYRMEGHPQIELLIFRKHMNEIHMTASDRGLVASFTAEHFNQYVNALQKNGVSVTLPQFVFEKEEMKSY